MSNDVKDINNSKRGMSSADIVFQQLLNRMKEKHNLPDIQPEKFSPEEYEQRKVDNYNATKGHLNEVDGYNCDLCNNKGDIRYIKDGYEYSRPCECMKTRKVIANMKKSGLEGNIRDYTFEKYEAAEEWQKNIKRMAKTYVEDIEPNWFFIGGSPGSGKTHICTAICREYLLKGKKVKYMLWKQESTLLKATINDTEVYTSKIEILKNAEVLYIDDFLKPVKDREGNTLPPTAADINLAFEILDYRKNAKLRTIISSERYIGELIDIDEATGSRIAEKTNGKYMTNIKRDRSKNYRLRGNFDFI